MRPKLCVAPKVAISKHSNIEKLNTEKLLMQKLFKKLF